MKVPAKKIYAWAAQKASSPLAPLWLGLVFLLEIVFFIPLDALLMLFCMENPKKRFVYALVAAIASTICGGIGYSLGYLLWDTIGPFVTTHLISLDFFNRLVTHYQQHENGAVLLGSFLPIPFKAVSLSAGFCGLALLPFLACVFVARALRFFLIAQSMQWWGDRIKAFVDKHFNRIIVAACAKIAIGVGFFWALSH